MNRVKANVISILLVSMNAGSIAAFAQTSQSWVDFLSRDKICAGHWSWVETIAGKEEIIKKTCEKRTVTVLDANGAPVRGLASGVAEVFIGEGSANIQTNDLEDARRRAIELVLAEYVKKGFDKNIYQVPAIANPSLLNGSYLYYSQVVGNQKIPFDAILAPRGVAREGWKCAPGGPVGVTGRDLLPSDCGKINITVEVYGRYYPVTYTLPTTQVEEQVDPFCSETEYRYTPEQRVIGSSEPFLTLAEVSKDSYLSIDGRSLKGASKSAFTCPHGIHLSEYKTQADYALAWLNQQKKPYDATDESMAATIRYLKALALEKGELLAADQLGAILRLQEQFPDLAFGGQETLENALETSPEELLVNRAKWEGLKQGLAGAKSDAIKAGTRLLEKLSIEPLRMSDSFTATSVSAEGSELIVSSISRSSSAIYRINAINGTITSVITPLRQSTVTTQTSKADRAYGELILSLLDMISSVRSQGPSGEELFQYIKSLSLSASPRLESAAFQLVNRLGSELTFKASPSLEFYSTGLFKLILGNQGVISLSYSSRSGFMNVDFFIDRDIRLERNGSGQKVYLSPLSAEYKSFLDELIRLTESESKAALAAGPAEIVPYFNDLLEYLNALKSESV